MPKTISIPIAVVVSIVIAMGGWLVNAQSKKDTHQDGEITENRKIINDKVLKKVDNDTLQMLLKTQEKNFDRIYDEIRDLRKQQNKLIEKINK